MHPLPMKSASLEDLRVELITTQRLIDWYLAMEKRQSTHISRQAIGLDTALENQIAASLISMHSLLTALNPLMREHLMKRGLLKKTRKLGQRHIHQNYHQDET